MRFSCRCMPLPRYRIFQAAGRFCILDAEIHRQQLCLSLIPLGDVNCSAINSMLSVACIRPSSPPSKSVDRSVGWSVTYLVFRRFPSAFCNTAQTPIKYSMYSALLFLLKSYGASGPLNCMISLSEILFWWGSKTRWILVLTFPTSLQRLAKNLLFHPN